MSKDIRVVVPNEFNYLRADSTNNSQAAVGMDKLVQFVTKSLLTEPGRDIFSPESGVGLRQALPRGARQNTEEGVLGDLTIAISRAQQEIQRQQVTEENAPEELLQSMSLLQAIFDEQNLKWEIWISVTNQAGETAQVPIT
jgi:hypothetical protein